MVSTTATPAHTDRPPPPTRPARQLVEALRWRASCLKAAASAESTTSLSDDSGGKVAALLSAGDALSAWCKAEGEAAAAATPAVGKDSNGSTAGAVSARELVSQTVSAGVRVSVGVRFVVFLWRVVVLCGVV